MKYYVNIGGTTIYGVTKVTKSADRQIDVYDGLGQGNFPVPNSAGLISYEIQCVLTETDDNLKDWRPAKRIFSRLESYRKSKDPERLVITTENSRTSKLVLLESYSCPETSDGVYETTIKLTEYKSVSQKTTDIPYIPRPGKIPEPEKVVFKNSTEVAADAVNRLRHNTTTDPSGFVNPDAQTKSFKYLWLDKDGKIQSATNPNLVPTNREVNVKESEPLRRATFSETFPHVASAFDAIGKAINDYRENVYLKGKDFK